MAVSKGLHLLYLHFEQPVLLSFYILFAPAGLTGGLRDACAAAAGCQIAGKLAADAAGSLTGQRVGGNIAQQRHGKVV